MDLDRYVEELRGQLMVAAEAGGDEARALADRLTAPLEASIRLMLLEVLSDAASEITLDLAPGSVEVLLRGREPEIVVTPPPPDEPPTLPTNRDVTSTSAPDEAEDGGTARITLRLPESLKLRIETEAGRQSLSVNSWLVRAIAAAVDPRDRPVPRPTDSPPVGSRFTGWAR
jgi:hypothetical protein